MSIWILLRENPSDVLVLPQFGSSGNPDINYDTKGTVWGVTIHTKPEEIYQALREGIAFQILMAYETLETFKIKLN